MNKIEQLHLDAIQNDNHIRKQLCVNDFGTSDLEKTVASKSAEITEQIAIEFWAWMRENDTSDNAEQYGNYTDKDIFQEFLKTKQ